MEIAQAHNFSDLIGVLKTSKRGGASEYSYDELASELGFKSPRSLAMVRKSQRAPSSALVRSVCEFLNVSPEERELILWLAEKSRLSLANKSTEKIDSKILRVKLELKKPASLQFCDSVPDGIRKKIEAYLEELTQEAKTSAQASRTGPAATGGNDSAKLPETDSIRLASKNQDHARLDHEAVLP